MEPYEVVAAPFEVYLADSGTAAPDIDDITLTDWTLIGDSERMNDDGVTVALNQETSEFTPAGLTEALKAWRTTEGRVISFSVADLSAATKAAVVDGTVDSTASGSGVAGKESVALRRGLTVTAYALLARGVSAEDEAYAAQYYEPKVYQSGSQSIQGKKGDPGIVAFEYKSLYDETNEPLWEDQTEAAS